jgi:TRAP-type C4-dicarboxylate transport system permease small subunit
MLFKVCDAIAALLRHILIWLGVILLVSVTLLVVARYIPGFPRWLWPLEIANWAMIWMVFVGASLALRDGKHFNVDLFRGKTPPPPVTLALKLIYYVFVGFVTMTFVAFGYDFVVRWAMIQTSEILMINLGYLYVSVPVAGLLWVLFLAEDLYKEIFLREKHPGEAR